MKKIKKLSELSFTRWLPGDESKKIKGGFDNCNLSTVLSVGNGNPWPGPETDIPTKPGGGVECICRCMGVEERGAFSSGVFFANRL